MPAAIPIAAAAIGAGASIYSANKSAKAASQPTTTSNTPYPGLVPYLLGTNVWGTPTGNTGLWPQAESVYQQTSGGYPGPYLAEQSPYSVQAIQGLADQARDPNSPNAQAINQLGSTIRGDYLDVTKNPYLSGAVQNALNQVRGTTSSAFSNENYGGSANQEWLGRNLANTALPIYANAYQQERQNQLNALALSPSLQQANLQQLGAAGAAQESRGQQEIQAAQQQFYAPWTPLENYSNILNSVPVPGSSSTTVPYSSSPFNAGLGGALAGWQLANQFGGLFNSGGTSAPNTPSQYFAYPNYDYSPYATGL